MVVGAGYIGLEVAEALLERGLDVTVVERLEAPMGAVLAAGINLRLGDDRLRTDTPQNLTALNGLEAT